jgi:DNA-binding transcriptional MerR regulator
MEEPWTILELTELAAETLAVTRPGGPEGGPARANGRVRDVPNERLIRWYVTVGLVDPPLSRRGRVARYGRRHLLQLVAVKRRQAEGRSLAEIQAELAGATDETLAAVACVPDIQPALQAAPAAQSRFWVRQPSQPTPAAERPGQPESGAADRGRADRGAAFPPAGLVHGVRLAPGVTLLLDGADREPGPDEVTEIVNAARPLVRKLADRGLCACSPGDPPGAQSHPPEVEQPAEESRT